MNADFPVLLDACVLANQRVTDLLLRLAETPRLYLPHWSERILDETERTLKDGYEPIEACVTNAPKDRHVLAAAIRARCEVVVTFNLKDFPDEALAPWGIATHHPSKFLANLYSLNGGLVVQRLHEISANLGRSVPAIIEGLAEFVPAFALQVASDIGIDL